MTAPPEERVATGDPTVAIVVHADARKAARDSDQLRDAIPLAMLRAGGRLSLT